MSKKQILFLSPFFYPENISTGKYNTNLATSLISRGFYLYFITSYPFYPKWTTKVCSDNLNGMTIYRGGKLVLYPNVIILRRVILEVWYSVHVVINYIKNRFNITKVVAVFPPSLFFMILLPLLPKKIQKIGIIHDLQSVYAKNNNHRIRFLLNYAIYFVEKICFTNCDKLIFLSYSMKINAISNYHLDENKCFVRYPFVSVANNDLKSDALVHLLSSDKFNVVYSGALGEKQNPDALFVFMNSIVSIQNNVECHIFSSGPIFERLRIDISRNCVCKVHFHELVPDEHLAELYARSDVQIIPQAPNTSEGSLPSKLPNILSAGVPVFAICDYGCELEYLVTHYNAGIVSNVWDINELNLKFQLFKKKYFIESKSDRKIRLQTLVKSKFNIDSLVDCVIGSENN